MSTEAIEIGTDVMLRARVVSGPNIDGRYVLHLVTPSPDQFYRWIVGLLLVAAVLIPILTYNQISVGIETAIVHLVIGLPSLTIIPAMAGKSVQRPAG